MRLYEYILSNTDTDELLTVLKKDCRKFIKQTGGFLYRGTNRRLGSETLFAKIKPREDRRPLDSPRAVHDLADQYLFSKFGWKVRSEGVFTSTDTDSASSYGSNMYLVFPIGDFKYVWSEDSRDFYITQSQLASDYTRSTGRSARPFPPEVMQDIADMYQDNKLYSAWTDGLSREVILHCPNGYYYVSTLSSDDLLDNLDI